MSLNAFPKRIRTDTLAFLAEPGRAAGLLLGLPVAGYYVGLSTERMTTLIKEVIKDEYAATVITRDPPHWLRGDVVEVGLRQVY